MNKTKSLDHFMASKTSLHSKSLSRLFSLKLFLITFLWFCAGFLYILYKNKSILNDLEESVLSSLAIQSAANDLVETNRFDHVERPCGSHIRYNEFEASSRRNVWQTFSDELIQSKIDSWKSFLSEKVPTINYADNNYNGRGIITTAKSSNLRYAIVSFKFLRVNGCSLPYEIWYVGNELSQDELNRLNHIGIITKNILTEKSKKPVFENITVEVSATERNYHIKTLAILLSDYQEVLFLDSDNVPLRDPEFLFESPEFKETGALFWNDYWKSPEDHIMWKITETTCEDDWEQESGEILVDKEKAWNGLLLSLHFQLDHEFYFSFILGDKDTFRFGFKASKTPFFKVRYPPGAIGFMQNGEFVGHSMLQPDLNGDPLFIHTTMMKSFGGIREGRSFDVVKYYKLAPMHLLPSMEEKENDHEKTFSVSYPVIRIGPGITLGVRSVEVTTTDEVLDKLGDFAIDSYQLISAKFDTFNNGSLAWFTPQYLKYLRESK